MPEPAEFPTTHKSSDVYPMPWPVAFVRDGWRQIDREYEVGEVDGLLTLKDHDPVVRLDLDAEGLTFLIEHLPEGDGFTEGLRFLRAIHAERVAQQIRGERDAA